jgi:8-oxo-dGTP pyrophosphatase MutT (NUDIX family)
MTDGVARRAARVLLVDADRRVLLFRGHDPHRPEITYWFTVGGGIDEGETPAQAAVRELAEETGLRVDESTLSGPVYHDVVEFPFEGVMYRQEQAFYLHQVNTWAVDRRGFQAEESRSIDAYRWWSLADLEATAETVYPRSLAALLQRVLPARPPGAPC